MTFKFLLLLPIKQPTLPHIYRVLLLSADESPWQRLMEKLFNSYSPQRINFPLLTLYFSSSDYQKFYTNPPNQIKSDSKSEKFSHACLCEFFFILVGPLIPVKGIQVITESDAEWTNKLFYNPVEGEFVNWRTVPVNAVQFLFYFYSECKASHFRCFVQPPFNFT